METRRIDEDADITHSAHELEGSRAKEDVGNAYGKGETPEVIRKVREANERMNEQEKGRGSSRELRAMGVKVECTGTEGEVAARSGRSMKASVEDEEECDRISVKKTTLTEPKC